MCTFHFCEKVEIFVYIYVCICEHLEHDEVGPLPYMDCFLRYKCKLKITPYIDVLLIHLHLNIKNTMKWRL